MQALKALFRRAPKPLPQITPAPAAGQGPTPLTPAEQKAVAGGLPRIGGFGTDSAIVANSTLG